MNNARKDSKRNLALFEQNLIILKPAKLISLSKIVGYSKKYYLSIPAIKILKINGLFLL